MPSSIEALDAKVGAICGIIAVIAIISLLSIPGVGTVSSPPAGQTAQETLATFNNTNAAANVFLHVLYAVLDIVFFIVLWFLLKGKNTTLAAAGAVFATTSQILLAASVWYSIATTATLASIYRDPASTIQDRATAVLLVKVLGVGTDNGVGDLAFFALGAALLIYGFLMMNSKTFPNLLGLMYLANGTAWLISTIALTIIGQALPPRFSVVGFVAFFGSLILSPIILFATSFFMWRYARLHLPHSREL